MDSEKPTQATTRVAPSGSLARSLRVKAGTLVVIEGPDRGRKFAFRAPGVTIGKSPDNDVVLTDGTVSKHHLSIEDAPDGFLLRDLKSTNGTFLDRNRTVEAYLSPGCTIRLGSTALRFEPPGDRIPILPSEAESFDQLKGRSLAIREVFGLLEKVAPSDATVLISGETGTGKEVVAQAIHDRSPRAANPFVVFDCSAVARDLLESALFGHQEGAFTGATAARKGAFTTATGGTILIDEIGELPSDLQPKLLRVLEKREVLPLGADHPRKVDVRVVAATHRDLKAMVRSGTFRQDLYYRLSVIEVSLPPLRDRSEDIPFLAAHFVECMGKGGHPIAPGAIDRLVGHTWPGNVRELKNVIERALVFAGDASIEAGHLSLAPADEAEGSEKLLAGDRTLRDVEIQVIVATLKKTGWNKTHAARILGISRRALLDKIERYALQP